MWNINVSFTEVFFYKLNANERPEYATQPKIINTVNNEET